MRGRSNNESKEDNRKYGLPYIIGGAQHYLDIADFICHIDFVPGGKRFL
jgi:hypothetical protein